jgi:hypothetical protein
MNVNFAYNADIEAALYSGSVVLRIYDIAPWHYVVWGTEHLSVTSIFKRWS